MTLSPVWHRRLKATRGLTNLVCQTFVIHPALFFFLFFLLAAHNSGTVGSMFLNEAERIVRDAPEGQVWDCISPASAVTEFPSIPPAAPELDDSALANLKAAPARVACVKTAVSRKVLAGELNSILLSLYITGVLLSIISSTAILLIRRRTYAR
ncbi:hypothetical protein [Erwinia mallotivora]|uniref:hypothetical protein n=1 Tax=Erwinia mallotivora TaxID=69222 RepID=UPI0021C0B6BF|nr:hypothetical protein [Erwinia mallotivora]